MNFFGVGAGEIILILIIAMMIMGPERMVKMSGEMGRLLVKLRRETDGVTREFREAFNLELGELKDVATDLQGAATDLQGMANDVQGAAQDINKLTQSPTTPSKDAKATPATTSMPGRKPATSPVGEAASVPVALAGAAFLDGETAVEKTLVRVTVDESTGVDNEEDGEAVAFDEGDLDDTAVVLDIAELVPEEDLASADVAPTVVELPDPVGEEPIFGEVELSDVSPSEGDAHVP
ncbi:MAG: Sec-independent protein translocase family protein [Anaerolineae bacterium]